MSYNDPQLLVSTDWLAEHIDAPDVRIVDASWYLPSQKRDTRGEYKSEHIPGAVFFDIDEICDTDSDLPHMLPSAEKFSSRVRKLGLGDGNRIVIYDSAGMFSAARAWWMFRVMGHEDVAVLNGGLKKWKDEDKALSDIPPLPRERHFTARLNNLMVRNADQMLRNVSSGRELVLDARMAPRFNGTVQEPRPELRSGHIPGSRNVPFNEMLNKDGTFKSPDDLKAIFDERGYARNKTIVTTCGSGVTASVLFMALTAIGHREIALYDGSWSEWGLREDLPIER